MGQRVRRAHRNYAQSSRTASHSLQHVVDSSIPAACKYGITSTHNGQSSLLGGVGARLSAHQRRFDACSLENLQDSVQVGIALSAATTGARVVEQGGLAHGGELASLPSFGVRPMSGKMKAEAS